MFKFIKRLLCKHENTVTITNLAGDAINMYNARSIRECKSCGKRLYMGLDKTCNIVNFKEDCYFTNREEV